jgi:hypothetical protein
VLRKWPSLNKQRVSASLGARPYMINEGTLDECIQEFMQLRETHRHLYEIHTAPQSDIVGPIMSTETSLSWRAGGIFSDSRCRDSQPTADHHHHRDAPKRKARSRALSSA